MKVLLAASEVAPIIKLGGLGDVAGSLPKAISKLGVDIDVIAPYFPFAHTDHMRVTKSIEMEVPYNGESNLVRVYRTKLPGTRVDVILLKNEKYFSGYGNQGVAQVSESEMFSFFDRSITSFIESKFNTYDLVHCNDWHTGMVVHLLDDELHAERPATLFSIHNLMYQGLSKLEVLWKLGITPGTHPLIEYDIADGYLNFLQQGISSADYVNTVSPSYADEILRGDYGGDLTDVLQARQARFCGILNGIDYNGFPRLFDKTNWREMRPKLKDDLQKQLGLNISAHSPIFSFVGRLDPNQKGIDILLDSVKNIVANGGQFVLLGTGAKEWEDKYMSLCDNPVLNGNISINLKFDNDLSQKIYSGSDFLLVPSKYEPCGLIQMIAMWYGCLPIVRDTGGLKDSVMDGHNGIKFTSYSTEDLNNAVNKAINTYNGQNLDSMVCNALDTDFGWDKSAIQYKDLYQKVINIRKEARNIVNNEEEL
jgi:starch synthase